MNTQLDLDLVLDEWMQDGPNSVADRVIDRVADQIDRAPQRHAWRLHGRPILMSRTVQIAATLAAALAITFAGYSLVPRSPGVGVGVLPTESPAPSSSPGPSPIAGVTPGPSAANWLFVTPAPSMGCEDGIPGCAGALQAGLHRSFQLDPRLYYVLPNDSWSNSIDSPDIFKLDYGANRNPYILVWVNPGIAKQTPGCDPVAQPGAHDAAAWRTFLTNLQGVTLENLVPVDLVGSADANGFEVDVKLDPSWKTMCGDWPYPQIPFIAREGDAAADYGVDTQGWLHIMVVDGGDRTYSGGPNPGSTMVIETYGPTDQRLFDEYVRTVQEVLHTFRFGCGPSVGYGPCSNNGLFPSESPSAPPA